MSLSLEGASDAELIAASNVASCLGVFSSMTLVIPRDLLDASECSRAVVDELKRRSDRREKEKAICPECGQPFGPTGMHLHARKT